MKRYLLDTFCWIERLQRGPKAASVIRLMEEKEAEILVSSVSLPEISAKLHASGRGADAYHVISAVMSSARVVEIDAAIAERAGNLWAEHHAKHNIGLFDCVIAASALVHEATIVTGDPHFKVFPNAKIL